MTNQREAEPGIGHNGGPTFITDYQASDITGYAVATLRSKRVRGGGPPFYRLDRGLIRYDRDEVIAWVRQHRPTSTAEADANDRRQRQLDGGAGRAP
jgi:hypothetical protein